jgi:phosphatidylglycerophosphate synthase
MGCFSEQEIAVARAYRYNGLDDSICVKLFYRRFWDFMIDFVPRWIAPNVLTFTGFLLEVTTFVLSFVYSEAMTRALPSWLCLLNAVFLFCYQTLDNLDGRQARRTGSSSALGQFFDHGCDAITGISELIKLGATFHFGRTTRAFYLVFLIGFGFVITSWQEYVTDFFYLSKVNAPDEGLGAIVIVYVLMAVDPTVARFAESRFWDYLIVTIFVFVVIQISITTIKTARREPAQRARLIPSTIPGIVTVALTFLLVRLHPADVADPFFMMSAGYVLQYLSQIIIVARLVGRPVRRLFDPTLVALWAAQIAYIAIPGLAQVKWFWKAFCATVLIFMVVFDVRVATGLAAGLQIRIFSLKKLRSE